MTRKRIIVGLSGGVDSAVSAWLLQQQGYEVQGLFMKNWEREDHTVACTASQDLADVRLVCQKLGIVLHTANFSEIYWNDVFSHFLSEYRAYRTPNPDILCNKIVKFKAFLEYAQQLGADAIATGHYADNVRVDQAYTLQTPVDMNKDQTYFLYTLGQHQLAHTLFPLAGYTKPEVRQLAAQIGLSNHAKKDSVGICFIGSRNFKTFLERYLKPNPGLIQTLSGDTVGQHDGLMYYTIGQRNGLKIGGKPNHASAPWYVAYKDIETNILRVVQDKNHPALYQKDLYCHTMSWVGEKAPQLPLHCLAKTRYRQTATPCVLSFEEDSKRYRVTFETPQRAITPGQAVVFYQGKICLGGGTIQNAFTA